MPAELADIGMEIARSLRPEMELAEAPAADPDRAPRREPAAAFAQVPRAIRLTLALEARTEAELCDWRAGAVTRLEACEAAADARREQHREKVRDLVMSVVDREASDEEDHVDLLDALDERLELAEAYAECAHRPLREPVEWLRADLQLNPDWVRWGDDAWIDDGPPIRPRCSPFHQPSRKQLLDPVTLELLAEAEPDT